MADDIVTRLRDSWRDHDPLSAEAADEIERLRHALALACGLLSTYEDHAMFPSDELMDQFLKEADRG